MYFGFEVIIIFLALMINAIFVAYEMALASISRARLMVLVNNKRHGAVEAAFMKDRMEASFAVVQVMITFFGAVAAAISGEIAVKSLTPILTKNFCVTGPFVDIISLFFLIIPLSFITIVFSELIPKTFALNHKVWICLTLSPWIKFLFHIGYPVITVLEMIVKTAIQFIDKRIPAKKGAEDQAGLHELIAVASLARASRLLGAREEKIVLSAAQLSIRPIRDIMIPLEEVCMISMNNTLTDALIKAHLDMHTRFPVCAIEGDGQTIVGYMNFKDIMMALKLNSADPTVRGIVRPIKSVPVTMAISQVLEQMMAERQHIAVVSSQDERILGMITLEDIIEELVGEIEDEYDRMPNYVHPYGGGWIMGGAVTLDMVSKTTGINLDTTPEKTENNLKLADWCTRKLGFILNGGEIIEEQGLRITVRKLRRKKLAEAIVNLVDKPT